MRYFYMDVVKRGTVVIDFGLKSFDAALLHVAINTRELCV